MALALAVANSDCLAMVSRPGALSPSRTTSPIVSSNSSLKLELETRVELIYRDASGRPQPSEEIVMRHIAALERIGYRTVGTQEAKLGEEYVLEQAREIEKRCTGVIHCEVFVQQGSGFHQCVSVPSAGHTQS